MFFCTLLKPIPDFVNVEISNLEFKALWVDMLMGLFASAVLSTFRKPRFAFVTAGVFSLVFSATFVSPIE